MNYEVENMRVGKRTDYDKITLEVITDGTLSPEAAFAKAVAILSEQFAAIATEVPAEAEEKPKKKVSKKKAVAAEEVVAAE